MNKLFFLTRCNWVDVYKSASNGSWAVCTDWVFYNFRIINKNIRVQVSSQPLNGSKRFYVKDLEKLDKYSFADTILKQFNNVIYIKITKA